MFFQFNLQLNCIPRYFTASVWVVIVWLMLTAGQWPSRRVNVMCDNLGSLTLIFQFFSHFWTMCKCFWTLSGTSRTVFTSCKYCCVVPNVPIIILVNDQLDALFLYVLISTPLHVSSSKCSSAGGPTCVNTPSGITHSGGWLTGRTGEDWPSWWWALAARNM